MNEGRTVRMSLEEIRRRRASDGDGTDWERLRREEAEGIEPEIDEDEFEVDWSTARVVIPESKQSVTLRVDPDVLAFFRSGGKGYQTRMNAVLRTYMEAVKARHSGS
jgi:uncharacterized protein (DUF4415 family)